MALELMEIDMRNVLLATVAIAALSATAASAADMGRPYTKAPVYAAPVYNWTGFYVGAHIGAGFGDDSDGVFTGAPGPAPAFTSNSSDAVFLGGGQIGADYQFAPNWLIGIEGQISALASNDRSFTVGAISLTDRTEWLASVTGRLGYTWGPGLIYAKGGVAFRDDNGVSVSLAGVAQPFTLSREQTGYTVGGGLEYMFAPSWSAKVEYQYYNFDRTDVFSPLTFTPATGVSYETDIHTVKVGLNYRFNWGGPVVAKY
jgi:outer membrane immunogenic protein